MEKQINRKTTTKNATSKFTSTTTFNESYKIVTK